MADQTAGIPPSVPLPPRSDAKSPLFDRRKAHTAGTAGLHSRRLRPETRSRVVERSACAWRISAFDSGLLGTTVPGHAARPLRGVTRSNRKALKPAPTGPRDLGVRFAYQARPQTALAISGQVTPGVPWGLEMRIIASDEDARAGTRRAFPALISAQAGGAVPRRSRQVASSAVTVLVGGRVATRAVIGDEDRDGLSLGSIADASNVGWAKGRPSRLSGARR